MAILFFCVALLLIALDQSVIPEPVPEKPKKKKRRFHQSYGWFIARRLALRLQRLKESARLQMFSPTWEWIPAGYNYCEECKAKSTDTRGGELVAIEVDHKKPVSQYLWLALDQSNLWCLCMPCNRAKGVGDTL